jgi:hypothetical protein
MALFDAVTTNSKVSRSRSLGGQGSCPVGLRSTCSVPLSADSLRVNSSSSRSVKFTDLILVELRFVLRNSVCRHKRGSGTLILRHPHLVYRNSLCYLQAASSFDTLFAPTPKLPFSHKSYCYIPPRPCSDRTLHTITTTSVQQHTDQPLLQIPRFILGSALVLFQRICIFWYFVFS